MTASFFNQTLQNASSRVAISTHQSISLLDKNEQSKDVAYDLKVRVMDKLLHADWNRYPSASYHDIETKIAEYCHLQTENIVLAGGSATIITTLLNYFALNHKNITIAQPSYSLFDYHCKTYNIPYTPWYLTEELTFDYDHMPILNEDSVMIITSPNNPTGNRFDIDKLKDLLHMYPQSLIILDGVYTEFCQDDVTLLINEYPNLIVLRSFSKAFPIAGLRLGYLCAHASIASMVKKLILQFSITPFSLTFAQEMLFDPLFMEDSKRRVQEIIQERNIMSNTLKQYFTEDVVKVFPSQGNFLLIKIIDTAMFTNLIDDLNEAGIKVLNTSSFTLLQNTFRVSMGNPTENKTFLHCMINSIASNYYTKFMLN